MTGMSDFQIGDTVKVEFEAVVKHVHHDGYLHLDNLGTAGEIVRPDHAVKIEPPVTVFGPGDYVRDPESGQMFLLFVGGYVQIEPHIGGANLFRNDWIGNGEEFTSENFERVELHESPL